MTPISFTDPCFGGIRNQIAAQVLTEYNAEFFGFMETSGIAGKYNGFYFSILRILHITFWSGWSCLESSWESVSHLSKCLLAFVVGCFVDLLYSEWNKISSLTLHQRSFILYSPNYQGGWAHLEMFLIQLTTFFKSSGQNNHPLSKSLIFSMYLIFFWIIIYEILSHY